MIIVVAKDSSGIKCNLVAGPRTSSFDTTRCGCMLEASKFHYCLEPPRSISSVVERLICNQITRVRFLDWALRKVLALASQTGLNPVAFGLECSTHSPSAVCSF